MLRTLTGSILLISLGALVGLAFGDATVGTLGALAGMVAWLFWLAVAPATARLPAGETGVQESRELLCMPRGQVTRCVFRRHPRTGRFLDVERCGLQEPDKEIDCRKKCLVLMNDSARHEPIASAN